MNGPDPVSRVLDRLTGVRRVRDHWLAQCPVHEDLRPSLDIAVGEDGRVLLHCWAGCPTEAVLASVGLGFRDRFVQRSHSRSVEVARWVIQDASGRVVAHLARYEPGRGCRGKSFAYFGPDGGRKGLAGLPLTDLPLYRSECVGGGPVVVSEGPKAADAVVAAGVCAVGTLTGAQSAPGQAALAVLRGHDVVLWPDFDPPGARHMTMVARALGGVVRSLSVIVPDPSWSAGVDAADLPPLSRSLLIGRARRLGPIRSQGEGTLGEDWDQLTAEVPSPCVDSPMRPRLIPDSAPAPRFTNATHAELSALATRYEVMSGRPATKGQLGLLAGAYRVHGPDTLALLDDLFAERGGVHYLLLELRCHQPRIKAA